MSKGTWYLVLRHEVPANYNILGLRFVLTLKETDTRKPNLKARFVVQGYRDREKNNVGA